MSAKTDIAIRVSRREFGLQLRGVDYCISEWGDADAPLLVYLHGWADVAATFQFVVDEFELDWRIVAPDWRGFGKSRCTTTSYWFPDYLADLDQLLEHLSPDQPVVLIGHSMGANVAGLYAGTMPERVRAFVNIEGFGLRDSDPSEAPVRYRMWIERVRSRPSFSEYRTFDELARVIRERSPRMTRAQSLYVAACWARKDGDTVRLRADPLHKLPNPVLYRRAEAEACWRSIEAPVLLVCGRESRFRQRSFEATSFVEIPAAGHMLHFEAPQALAAAIESFLSEAL